MDQIPVFKPLIETEELEAAAHSLKVGWLGMGASVGQFEEALKQYLGCKSYQVVAVSTGHAALHLAMMLIKLKQGDEVITPSFNNIADFQAILAMGATPVFCDICEDTLCIDAEKAQELITPKTKAIIAMDYNCCTAEHDEINYIAKNNDLRVIHDAAHSLGSYYHEKKIGTFSDICMFSFDPVKTITCIDGGALVVKTQEEAEQLHQMRLIGMGQPINVMYGNQRAWTYDVKQIGFRYHMSNLHAAIGLSQLSKIEIIEKSRRDTCKLYNQLLSSVENIIIPNSSFDRVTPFLYYIRVPCDIRQSLRDYLKMRGVDTGIHWQPGHTFSLFSKCKTGDLTITNKIANEIISLPLHSCMDKSTVEFICTEIKNYIDGGNRI